MRATLILALGAPLLLLAGCNRHQPLISSSTLASSVPVSNPVTGEPGYVGRWASSRAGCADRAWVLTSGEMRSANGLNCTFVKMNPGSAGFGGDVDCGTAGARKAGHMTLTLTGAADARGLTLLGGPFELPVTLEACSATVSTAAAPSPDGQPPA